MINVKEVVLQPIGNNYKTIEAFKEENYERWAEKNKYLKEWEKLEDKLVLFTQEGRIFAKAIVTRIENSKHSEYPLNYYYENIEYININFSKIRELLSFSKPYRNFEALNIEDSKTIINYLNSLTVIPYISDEDYQNDIDKAEAKNQDDKSELPREFVTLEGRLRYPRSVSYAKSALYRANYQCEVDNNHITFISKVSQKNYVEAHHLIPLKLQNDSEFDYNLDVPANIVALCPNCHRKIHSGLSSEKNMMLDFLYQKHRDRLDIVKLNQEGLLEYLKEIY